MEERITGPQPPQETIIVLSDGATVDDPAFQEFVDDL